MSLGLVASMIEILFYVPMLPLDKCAVKYSHVQVPPKIPNIGNNSTRLISVAYKQTNKQ